MSGDVVDQGVFMYDFFFDAMVLTHTYYNQNVGN